MTENQATEGTTAKPKTTACPFTIVIDTREQQPYNFIGLSEGVGDKKKQIIVKTLRCTLRDGDYSIFDLPMIAVERKSLSDLYGSVSRRDNFEARLLRMSDSYQYAAVMVEAEISTILKAPPPHSKLNPKSLIRTIIAWRQRYKVDWFFLPGREACEAATFRVLERFWKDHKELHEALVRITADKVAN